MGSSDMRVSSYFLDEACYLSSAAGNHPGFNSGTPGGLPKLAKPTDVALNPPCVLVTLHAFIKKTQKTPDDELLLARKRQKEMKS